MNAHLRIAHALSVDAPAEECEVDYGRACPTIPDTEYRAVFTHPEKAYSFSTPKVFLWFRIIDPGPHFGMMIYAAYSVRQLKGKLRKHGGFTVAAHGELFVMVCKVLSECGRPDRFSLLRLKEKILRIKTRTVKRDYRQREIPEARRYSVVDAIVGCNTG